MHEHALSSCSPLTPAAAARSSSSAASLPHIRIDEALRDAARDMARGSEWRVQAAVQLLNLADILAVAGAPHPAEEACRGLPEAAGEAELDLERLCDAAVGDPVGANLQAAAERAGSSVHRANCALAKLRALGTDARDRGTACAATVHLEPSEWLDVFARCDGLAHRARRSPLQLYRMAKLVRVRAAARVEALLGRALRNTPTFL